MTNGMQHRESSRSEKKNEIKEKNCKCKYRTLLLCFCFLTISPSNKKYISNNICIYIVLCSVAY